MGRQQFVAAAEFLQLLDGLDLEAVVNRLGSLWPDAWDANKFDKTLRYFSLQILEENHLSGVDVLHDFLRQILSDSGNLLQRTLSHKYFDIVGQVLEARCGAAVGADAKRICDLDLEQIGDLIENGSNLKISHFLYPSL